MNDQTNVDGNGTSGSSIDYGERERKGKTLHAISVAEAEETGDTQEATHWVTGKKLPLKKILEHRAAKKAQAKALDQSYERAKEYYEAAEAKKTQAKAQAEQNPKKKKKKKKKRIKLTGKGNSRVSNEYRRFVTGRPGGKKTKRKKNKKRRKSRKRTKKRRKSRKRKRKTKRKTKKRKRKRRKGTRKRR